MHCDFTVTVLYIPFIRIPVLLLCLVATKSHCNVIHTECKMFYYIFKVGLYIFEHILVLSKQEDYKKKKAQG